MLRLAASAEHLSEHPLAQAIVMAARERNLPITEPAEFENLAGKGVRIRLEDAEILLGSPRLVKEEGIPISASDAELIESHEAQGRTLVVVARDGRLTGIIAIADTLKPDAKAAIAQLHSQGLRTAMITGDNEAAARPIAHELGIEREFAQVLPHEKVQKVRELQAEGFRVAFVGMVSMMRRRWLRPISASPWEPGPISR